MSALPREDRTFTAPTAFDHIIAFVRVNAEMIGYAALILASVVMHLWALGHMAMHHDESIHAWMSWKFFTGSGGFNCVGGRTSATYCYDPVYHGPSLYVLTLLSYFFFGISEATARLPQALAGIGMVASAWMLRPLLGRRAALIAAVLLAFAPTLLYYTRFARHDGLMILWTLWIVIGFFRFLQEGRGRWLMLLAVGAALAVATHELYYILIFLFGFFLITRLLSELLPRRTTMIVLAVIFGLAVVGEIVASVLTLSEKYVGIALLVATVSGVGLLLHRIWDTRPLVSARLVQAWREQRGIVWASVATFVALYVVLYTAFFTDAWGILGAYYGISYWLGSQQEYARGKQPWYYYLMLLPLYEPLGFFGAVSVSLALLFGSRPNREGSGVRGQGSGAGERATDNQQLTTDNGQLTTNNEQLTTNNEQLTTDIYLFADTITRSLTPLFLAFWFIGALIAFSWAGEKMPWLVVHIALPANLLIAWGLSELAKRVDWRESRSAAALVPAVVVLLAVAIGVVLWRFSEGGSAEVDIQGWLLAGVIPLIFAGGLIYALLTLAQRLGGRATFFITVFTVAALLGGYMVRATWMVVYEHPDTPKELLFYTQTSPDVPLIVDELRVLGINQTRSIRSSADPEGGHTMPVIMDTGGDGGEGSLAWPFQWYLRDFQRLESRGADFFANASATTFEVQKPGAAEGTTELAPVVMVSSSHVTEQTRKALEQNYTKRYDSTLNWWFPEGDLTGCNPDIPGYKQFYYSTLSINRAKQDPDCAGINFETVQYHGPLAPVTWLFDREHWSDTFRFVIWRDLPDPLRIDGREMQVWVRSDLAPGAGSPAETGSTSAATLRLLAERSYGAPGSESGLLGEPRGVAVDGQNNVYVADTGNNRVNIYGSDGTLLRSFGSFGAGEGQFNEPRGIALDAQNNIYVADTWNARVAKFDSQGVFLKSWGVGKQDFGEGRVATATDRTATGNAAEPLGFFGPRGLAVDGQGNVYVADTGNRRIVVTDSEGNFRYQWGYEGSGEGQFVEPIGVAIDAAGHVYVADVWNGRVQVFTPGVETQNVSAQPSAVWNVAGWEANTYDDPYLAAAADGTVYLTVPSRNQAVAYSPSGQVLLRWGGAGSDFASLNLPSGISIGASGRVFIADRGNGRVMEFSVPAIAPPTTPLGSLTSP